SPFHFARAFEKEIGLPPHAYLEAVRLRKARELLDRGEPIVEAGLRLGYSDQSHFTNRFKRALGITPGQYIRQRRILQDVSPGKGGPWFSWLERCPVTAEVGIWSLVAPAIPKLRTYRKSSNFVWAQCAYRPHRGSIHFFK